MRYLDTPNYQNRKYIRSSRDIKKIHWGRGVQCGILVSPLFRVPLGSAMIADSGLIGSSVTAWTGHGWV